MTHDLATDYATFLVRKSGDTIEAIAVEDERGEFYVQLRQRHTGIPFGQGRYYDAFVLMRFLMSHGLLDPETTHVIRSHEDADFLVKFGSQEMAEEYRVFELRGESQFYIEPVA